jgi:hypothetical protein
MEHAAVVVTDSAVEREARRSPGDLRVEAWTGACDRARVNLFDRRSYVHRGGENVTFLLWCILLVLCWPLALFAVVVYPLVWILLIPFRVLGIVVDGVLGLLRGIIMLPVRLVSGPRAW